MNMEGERLQHPKTGWGSTNLWSASWMAKSHTSMSILYVEEGQVIFGVVVIVGSITLVWQHTFENEFQSYITYFVAF